MTSSMSRRPGSLGTSSRSCAGPAVASARAREGQAGSALGSFVLQVWKGAWSHLVWFPRLPAGEAGSTGVGTWGSPLLLGVPPAALGAPPWQAGRLQLCLEPLPSFPREAPHPVLFPRPPGPGLQTSSSPTRSIAFCLMGVTAPLATAEVCWGDGEAWGHGWHRNPKAQSPVARGSDPWGQS